MKLSIIIVSFNTKEIITKCLNAIFESEKFTDNFEIIIIDNASKDGSVTYLKEKFPHIKIISLEKNIGFAAANNIGVKNSTGEYVLFLNPDVIVEKNTIQKALEYIEANEKCGIITAKLILENGNIDDACHRGFPTPWNAFCHFSGLSKIFPNSKIFTGYSMNYLNKNVIHEVDSVSGAFMMIKRSVGEQFSWWDEDYFWYGDDLDFCYRVKMGGWKIIYNPTVKALHYKGISSGIKKDSKHLSKADYETKLKATQARFDVMEIFYKKHYEKIYPKLITSIVLSGIKLKKTITLRMMK
jgi:GT2 family glycosyltransferase